MSQLSDLELAVLGLVWKLRTCTPYVVRTQFSQSPTVHWSGSAGAIYPLMKRLEDRGLLRAVDSARGLQKARAYSITPAGLRHLRRWLSPPIAAADASLSFDIIRTRMHFIAAVTPARRRALIADATAKLQAEVDREDANYRRRLSEDDVPEAAASYGALLLLRARLQWLLLATRGIVSGAMRHLPPPPAPLANAPRATPRAKARGTASPRARARRAGA